MGVPLSLFMIYVLGLGLEVWMSLVWTKRCAEYLFLHKKSYVVNTAPYNIMEQGNHHLTLTQPICDNQCNLHDLRQLVAFDSGEFLVSLRHKFISVGLGMVYTCRPQRHLPVMEVAMVVGQSPRDSTVARMKTFIGSRRQDGVFLLFAACVI